MQSIKWVMQVSLALLICQAAVECNSTHQR
jgi:hypothetical protein